MVISSGAFLIFCSISQKPYIIWLSFMVQMYKMIISPGVFFSVKILIFLGCLGPKRTKHVLKWRKFLSVAPYISGTIYHHHLWYTCMYKRIISPGILFIFFSKFWFLGSLGGWREGCGKRVKNGPKWQKNSIRLTLYLRNHTSYNCDFWYTCVKWWKIM